MKDLKIATKLVGVIGIVVVAASVAVGWFVVSGAEQALTAQTRAQLEAERASRARFLSLYFRRLNEQLRISSRQLVTQIALRDLRASPDRVLGLFHPYAAGLVEAFGYANVMLTTPEGAVAYTFNGEGAGGDLKTGPLQHTGVAAAFAAAASSNAGQVHFVDYESHPPAGVPAAFASIAVFDTASNARLGTLIFRIPVDEISDIVTDAAGFGASGETYLIGPDLLMRTNSRFSAQPTALKQKITTPAASRALAGETATIDQIDYRGVPVIASFAPVDVGNVRWAIVSKIDVAEALGPARLLRTRLLILLLVVGLIAGFVLWESLRRIVLSPVAALAAGARRVAARDYTRPVALRGGDELGQLGQSFDGMMGAVDLQVDELKRAHQAAERGERLLEIAPDAVVVADETGHIARVNGATERLFGYRRDELVGQHIEVLVPEASRDQHVGHRDGFIAHPTTRAMGSGLELMGRRKNGSLVPIEISLSPLKDSDGLLVVAVVRDITERREAQRLIAESEERLAAAARGANLGLWDVTPATGEVLVNAIFESQLGYAPTALREAEGKWAPLRGGLEAWVNLLHPDDRERVAGNIADYLEGGEEIYHGEHRVRAADGSYKWILSVGNSVSRDVLGRPLRVNGVHIDISEMKGLQLDLQLRYEDLQRLQGMRDGLVHMIIHDLRSPLTSVMGYLDLIRTMPDPSPEQVTKFVGESYDGASQMAEMISSLLDINRLEAGEMPVDRQPADLSEVAAEALRSLGGLIVGRKVAQAPSSGPVMCNCDAALIRRVITNLMGNALKFTPSSGSITVMVSNAGSGARVEVADTGPGIPPEFLEKVFDKFSQGAEGRARKRYSTGLGLAFCKLAVEAHGGTVGVSSEVGVGSRFWFQLP